MFDPDYYKSGKIYLFYDILPGFAGHLKEKRIK